MMSSKRSEIALPVRSQFERSLIIDGEHFKGFGLYEKFVKKNELNNLILKGLTNIIYHLYVILKFLFCNANILYYNNIMDHLVCTIIKINGDFLNAGR